MSNQSSAFRPERRVHWQEGIEPSGLGPFPGDVGVPNQSSSFPKRTGIEIVREIDGVPSFTDITILEVSNGTLTSPSPGVARLSTGGGGGGGGLTIPMGFKGFIPGVGAAEQYMRVVDRTITSNVGIALTAAGTLIGMSIVVDFAHPTNAYVLEAIEDPTGRQGVGPLLLGAASLALPATSRGENVRALGETVVAGREIGARVRRTSGSGNSSPMKEFTVLLEFTIP